MKIKWRKWGQALRTTFMFVICMIVVWLYTNLAIQYGIDICIDATNKKPPIKTGVFLPSKAIPLGETWLMKESL